MFAYEEEENRVIFGFPKESRMGGSLIDFLGGTLKAEGEEDIAEGYRKRLCT